MAMHPLHKKGSRTLLSERRVLNALFHMLERERRLVLQEEVAAACSRTRGAVAPHLRSLEQKGLLCRPAGERQGYAPTPRGERCR